MINLDGSIVEAGHGPYGQDGKGNFTVISIIVAANFGIDASGNLTVHKFSSDGGSISSDGAGNLAVEGATTLGGALTFLSDSGIDLDFGPLKNVGGINVSSMPSGTLIAPPAGLNVGDFWLDTSSPGSTQYPIVRIRAS